MPNRHPHLDGQRSRWYEKVPVSSKAAPILARLKEHRAALGEHNPEALALAAEALAAAHEAAWQKVPMVACDRTARYREDQLLGGKGFPLEDLVAVGLEGEDGRRVACAALAQINAALVARAPAPEKPHAVIGVLARELGDVIDAYFAATADGRVDPDERALLVAEIAELETAVARMKAAVLAPAGSCGRARVDRAAFERWAGVRPSE
jgi:hypothetical protein